MVRGAWRASAPVAPRRRARGVLAARSNRAGAFAGALSAAARAQGARGAGGPPARVGPGGRAAGGRPAAAPACRRLLRRRLSDPPGHARLRRLAAGRGRRAPARARARRAPALSQLAVRRRAGLARGAPSRAPVRAGGRWDGLLQAAWAPFALSAGAPPCAAGVTLNVDRLLDCLPAARAPALRASQARCALRWREGRGCRLRGGVMRRRPVRRVAHDRGASGATQAGPAAALSGTAPLRGRGRAHWRRAARVRAEARARRAGGGAGLRARRRRAAAGAHDAGRAALGRGRACGDPAGGRALADRTVRVCARARHCLARHPGSRHAARRRHRAGAAAGSRPAQARAASRAGAPAAGPGAPLRAAC